MGSISPIWTPHKVDGRRERDALRIILRMQAHRSSASREQMRCDIIAPAEIRIPTTNKQTLGSHIGTVAQQERFTWKVHPSNGRPGLHNLAIDPDGVMKWRHNAPAKQNVTQLTKPDGLQAGDTLLVAWWPGATVDVQLPS